MDALKTDRRALCGHGGFRFANAMMQMGGEGQAYQVAIDG